MPQQFSRGPVTDKQEPTDSLDEIESAITQKAFDRAEEGIRNRLLADPGDPRALELSGDLASAKADLATAIAMYQEAVAHQAASSPKLWDKLVQHWMLRGMPFDAIETLEQTISQHPTLLQPRFDLAGLAAMVGMPEKAVPSLRWLATHNQGDAESLLVLSDPLRVQPDAEACNAWLKRSGGDARLQFPLAKLDAMQLRWDSVELRLKDAVAQQPSFLPSYLLYGRALIELGRFQDVADWAERRPAGAELTAEYQMIVAMWAQHFGRHEEAARSFWEALNYDEIAYSEVFPSLLISLQSLERADEASFVSEQIVKYGRVRDSIKTHLERSSLSQRAAMDVAFAMASLGRVWEAEAWARLGLTLPEDRVIDAKDRYLNIRANLHVNSAWQIPESSFIANANLSSLPKLAWNSVPNEARTQISQSKQPNRFHFVDEAAERKWLHTCDVGTESAGQGLWIYQTVGGGVAVIDYDADGWPDLAVANLSGSPLQADSSPNRLFRNLNGTFQEIGELASYADTGYSQGIAAGDYNADGFPDLFDANIGMNRLYRNNGDGTFTDVTVEAGLSGNRWSTSIAIADINGDGHADLYEACYCKGKTPYTQACKNAKGIVSTCPPLKFEAEPDHIWLGSGDGRFSNMTSVTMNQTEPGRGLGIVVGHLDERPGQDVYVANDMTVNHLWSGEKSIRNATNVAFKLTDIGAVRGLGFDSRSQSQASMGMAAGDADNDGDIDFYLTHFFNDHNTYYEQVAPGFWADRSTQTGLAEPSIDLLGFGTQFIDVDNDGSLELFIANGHVDETPNSKTPFRMPAQLFERFADGKWQDRSDSALGDYFSTMHLGRAVAIVDANRDGRTDLAVTHLFEPVALLVNHTKDAGNSISFEFRSSIGHRDAVGTKISMTVGVNRLSAQLTAGDGYMCSNQRRIHIGTELAAEVQNVTITWPSGQIDQLGALATQREYLVVEGEPHPFVFHGQN